jgi:serine/threonine protein kinase
LYFILNNFSIILISFNLYILLLLFEIISPNYITSGNLYRFLKANRLGLLLDCEVLTDMCRQVCRGMEYLHNQGYILRNLSAKNCLVGNNGIVKVSDFARARFVCLLYSLIVLVLKHEGSLFASTKCMDSIFKM